MKKTAMLVLAGTLLWGAPAFADAAESAKLTQVLANQEKILKSLDEIKAELQIVKIRATNK